MSSDFMKFLMIAHEANMVSENEDEHVRSYSGRGMYGNECPGITCRNTHMVIMRLCEGAESLTDYCRSNGTNPHEDGEIFKVSEVIGDRISTDSMGCDSIVYFPNLKWDHEEYDRFYKWKIALPQE